MTDFPEIPQGTMVCVQASDIDYYVNYGIYIVAKPITTDVARELRQFFDLMESNSNVWLDNSDAVTWLAKNGYLTKCPNAVNLCVGGVIVEGELTVEAFDDPA